MSYRLRGMGEDCAFPYLSTTCVKSGWSWLFPDAPRALAVPPIPSGSHGEQVFPVAGSSGGVTLPTSGTPDDVISEAVDAQMTEQQKLNAGQVQGSWLWTAEAAAVNAADAAADAANAAVKTVTSPWLWLAVGLGVFGFVAIAAGSPRRYGR